MQRQRELAQLIRLPHGDATAKVEGQRWSDDVGQCQCGHGYAKRRRLSIYLQEHKSQDERYQTRRWVHPESLTKDGGTRRTLSDSDDHRNYQRYGGRRGDADLLAFRDRQQAGRNHPGHRERIGEVVERC